MSTNNIDLQALDRDLQAFAQQEKQRGWWSRNWLWFVPTLLIVLFICCCGGPALIGFNIASKALRSGPYETAMQKILADPTLKQELGEPIEEVSWIPAGRLEFENDRGEADLRFDLSGPKGQAKAHMQARCTNAKWELTVLEVTLASGKTIQLLTDDGNDAPAFKATKPAGGKPEAKGPAPELNFSIPSDDNGPGK